MIQLLDSLDKSLSQRFHSFDSRIVTLILYPFARLFNPQFIIIPILFVAYLGKQLAVFAHPQEAALFASFYALVCIPGNLAVSLATKKIFSRPRPVFNKSLQNKPASFRGREHNCSFPSGDAIQAAVFLTTVLELLQRSQLYETHLAASFLYLIALQLGVSAGRVYFMCHYFGDTLVGSLMGYLLTRSLHSLLYLPYCGLVRSLF